MISFKDLMDMESEETQYNSSFSGDTYYLDLFMNDCYTYKDSHNALKKKKNYSHSILITIFFIVLFAMSFSDMTFSINVKDLLTYIVPLLFISLTGLGIYYILRKKSSGSEISDDINYNYINDFFNANNIRRFDRFGSSFCINNGSTYLS